MSGSRLYPLPCVMLYGLPHYGSWQFRHLNSCYYRQYVILVTPQCDVRVTVVRGSPFINRVTAGDSLRVVLVGHSGARASVPVAHWQSR